MDEYFMEQAILQAKLAENINEVPIGCVITLGEQIIGTGFNRRTSMKNALYHAEVIAINEASAVVSDWRLEECVLYVTVEPCPMCAGAIVQARIPRVVFGAKNKKAGCAGSVLNILNEPNFNHQVEVTDGVLGEQCALLMSNFFKRFRNKDV